MTETDAEKKARVARMHALADEIRSLGGLEFQRMGNLRPDRQDLPTYIVGWLRARNGGELWHAFAEMKLEDYETLLVELALILKHGGHPPNWLSGPGELRLARTCPKCKAQGHPPCSYCGEP